MVCPADRVIVSIDKKFQDEIQLAGTSLSIDTWINQNEHATLYGTVVSVPDVLLREDIANITPNLRIGDKVYFSYIVIYDQEQTRTEYHFRNEFKHEGQSYWLVDYSDIFFAERNGEVIMVGDHVLVEPYIETKDLGIELPDYVKTRERKDSGTVVAGKMKGDKIRFESKYVQQYHFHGLGREKMFIVKKDRILAKWL